MKEEDNYKKLVTKYPKIKYEKNSQSFFNATALSIANINFTNLIIAYTSSNSIFFSLNTTDNYYEFNLEIFLDYNKEDDTDVQATLNYFISGLRSKTSYYGTINELSNSIKDIINPKNKYELYKDAFSMDHFEMEDFFYKKAN